MPPGAARGHRGPSRQEDSLTPTPAVPPRGGERGLASRGPADVAGRTLAAWDALLDLVAGVDGRRPSRVPGWSGHDVLVRLGSWPGQPGLARLLTEARGESAPAAPDEDARIAALLAAHRNEPPAAVAAALEAAREETAELLAHPEADELGRALVGSPLGPLPLLTLVHASAYELAVHALDLGPCGAGPPPPALTSAGLAALVDVTAALAARLGVTTTAAALTPDGGWVMGSASSDWTVAEVVAGTGDPHWPAVEGRAQVILDVSAGRVAVPGLLARRELRLHHVGGLLALAPIVEAVPGLPGGPALTAAVRYVSGAGRLVRRLPGLG